MIHSAVIEEVDVLMSQRLGNYFLIVHNCWEISLVVEMHPSQSAAVEGKFSRSV